MNVEVRTARAVELAAVGELTVRAYEADGSISPGDSYAGMLRDAESRARNADLLVAVGPEEDLLGTVTVCAPGTPWAEVARPGELEFRMLAVRPSARGRGVGELLTRAVLDRAAAAAVHRVVLCSSDHMHAAHRLYRRLGFSRIPERDWSPSPAVALLAFALDLPD